MKRSLSLVGMVLCGSLLSFAGPMYTDVGMVAPAFTFTAATSGDEVGYFYGSTAGDLDEIGFWDNGIQLGAWSLSNHGSNFGESVNFGHVNAGDTIVFALEDVSRGYTVYSDPTMNSDGINHAYTTSFDWTAKGSVTIPAGTFVSFEDLLMPHSDLNYNDEDVVFSDLAATPLASTTPEPSSVLLLGLGLVGTALGIARKRRA